MYDFVLELKKKYNEVKDKEIGTVSYSLSYIPWLLNFTAEIYVKHHKYYDFNELLSVAFTASVSAEKSYDPNKGAFSTYAKYAVEGALNEYVSKMSKSQANNQKAIQDFILNYFAEHKAYPSEDIILSSLKMSKDTYNNALSTHTELQNIDEVENILSEDKSPEQQLILEDYIQAMDFIDVDYKGVLRLRLIDDLSFNTINRMINDKAQSLYDKAIVEYRSELLRRGLSQEDLE